MLWNLPAETVGASVLAMLSVADIVHLDTAWLAKGHRSHWFDSIRFSPPLVLPEKACDNITVLTWVCGRNMKLLNVVLCDSLLTSLGLLSRHPGMLAGGATIRVTDWSLFIGACSGYLAESELLASKIVKLDLWSYPDKDFPVERMCNPAVFRCLSSLEFRIYSTMEQFLPFVTSLMVQNPLQQLLASFAQRAPQEFWSALKVRGTTLTDLALYCEVNEADIRVIAESCVNLTRLNMSGTVTERGVIMVVKSCRKLVDIDIGSDRLTDMDALPNNTLVIAEIFRYCRNLQSLRFANAPMTKRAMFTLSTYHCPLKTLMCAWAAAPCAFIAACASDFATLEEVEFGGIFVGTCEALAAAVCLMPQLRRLVLRPM